MDPVAVFGDFLRPVLEAAGFQRDGEQWTSKRGDALLSVRASLDRIARTLEAGITFGAGPELFTLRLHQGVRPEEYPYGPMCGEYWHADQPVNEASVVETFHCHILRFFKDTSTREEALDEAAREGQFGDCGPFSRYEPEVNHDALRVLKLARMDPVAVFGDFLRPVLEAAGFKPDGERWTSRRGDALLSVRASRDRIARTLEAGVTFGAGPELFTLRLHRGVLPQDDKGGPMRGESWDVDQPVNEASVVETFHCHILRFFEDTSTREGALAEAAREGQHGDCGPFSRYEPHVNHEALEALE